MIKLGVRYLFDLPIYRLLEAQYEQSQNEYVDKIMTEAPLPGTPSQPSTANELSPSDEWMVWHLRQAYGGSWQFNEIVGYLRLHLLGTQLRAEQWMVKRKRMVRTRKKTLEFISHKCVSETELGHLSTNEAILQNVRHHIQECKRLLAPRYVDDALLNQLGEYIDWKALLD